MNTPDRKNWKKFIKRCRNRYMKIGYVTCPAFGNEKIYFTQAGFNHLLRKGRIPRKINDQMRRLSLVSKAPLILTECTRYSTHEKRYSSSLPADFWSFVYNGKDTHGQSITIIVRQIQGKPKHFFSIFDEKNIS